jgi:hypothetical protein
MKVIATALVALLIVTAPAQAEIVKELVGERTINVAPLGSPTYRCEQRWKYTNTETGEVRYTTTRESGAC